MKKSIFMVMALAAVLTSCSKSEVDNPTGVASDDIVLKSSVVNVSAVSRTAYEGTDLVANPLEALVFASLSPGNYGTLHCYGTMNFNGSPTGTSYDKPVLGGDYKYPSGTTQVYLTALHPSSGWTGVDLSDPTDPNTTGGKMEIALTGKEDVMIAPQVQTRLNDVNSGTYASLNFAHQLTLMKLSLVCDNDAANSIKVKSIELVQANKADLKSNVAVTLGTTSTIAFDAPTVATPMPCYAKGTDNAYSFTTGSEYEVTTVASEQAYVIAPPVDASNAVDAKEYTFRVTYLDGTNEKVKDVGVDLKANASTLLTGTTVNKAFNITLKFVGGEIVSNASITDWETPVDIEQEI